MPALFHISYSLIVDTIFAITAAATRRHSASEVDSRHYATYGIVTRLATHTERRRIYSALPAMRHRHATRRRRQ